MEYYTRINCYDTNHFVLIDLHMTNLIIILTTWHYSTHLLIQVFLLYYTFDSRWTFSYSELGCWLPILLYLGFNHIQSLLLFSVFTAITPRPISFLCCGGRALGTFLCNSLGISFPAIRLVNFYAHHCTPGLDNFNPINPRPLIWGLASWEILYIIKYSLHT